MLESALLKVYASESLWKIIYDTMQIFGGRSLFTDIPLERMMRDARLNMIGEGSNEVMRAFIAAVGMRDVGMAIKGAMLTVKEPITHFKKVMQLFGNCIKNCQLPTIPIHSKELKKERKAYARALRRFRFSVVYTLIKYREGVVDKQLELNRLTEGAMMLYTMAAVLSKMDSEEKLSTKELQVGKLYCRLALQKLHENLDSLKNSDDAFIVEVSDSLTGLSS